MAKKSTAKKTKKAAAKPGGKASARKAGSPSGSRAKAAGSKKSAAKSASKRPKKPSAAKATEKSGAPPASAKSTKPAKGSKPAQGRGRAGSADGQDAKGKRSVAAAASAAAADAQGYVFINGRRVRMISTKGLSNSRKTRRSGASLENAEASERELKPLKTRLNKQDLQKYHNLLLLKRAELVGDLSAMEAEALRSSGGDLSHMPIHMADIGTDTFDQDFMLGLAESERKLVREIDEALKRIDEGTYGVCQMTGKHIPKARLDAKPWARFTIEAARMHEQGRVL